jgi:hypothetical protein
MTTTGRTPTTKPALLFVAALAACEQDELARTKAHVDVVREGLGDVTQETPEYDECPKGADAGCRFEHESGTPIVLVAVAESAWEFAGWDGECAAHGTGAKCAFHLQTSVDVIARFVPVVPDFVQLSVNVDGPGTVTSSPAGIDCPGACTASFPWETTIVLTATGDAFAGWDLACTGTEPTCTIPSIDQATVVAASFE